MKFIKNSLRKELLNRRNDLSELEIAKKSDLIFMNIKNLLVNEKFKIISVYLSTEKEVQTNKIINWLLENNYRVVVPYMDENKTMLMKEIHDLDFEKTIFMGINQPTSSYKNMEFECIDLTIVPGLGFDKNMNRIGYGLGCYDTYFEKTNSAKWMVAFELQNVEQIPVEKHDAPMDLIITEAYTI